MKNLLLLTLVTCLLISSCKKGDTGPAGPAGPSGATGPTGPKGTDANVIYSDWTPIHFVSNNHPTGENSIESLLNYIQRIDAPKLTNEIVDKGAVLIYAKNSEGTSFTLVNSTIGSAIIDKLDNGDGTTSLFEYDVMPLYKTGKVVVGLLAGNDEDGAEMATIVNGTGGAIRYVLLPGLTAGRSRYTIDQLRKMPYADAMNALGIKP